MRVLTDAEIAELLADEKRLPADWQQKLRLKQKAGQAFRQRQMDIESVGGRRFELIVRTNTLNPLDFSVILAYMEANTNHRYLLIRHNGKHPSDHTNKIEHRQGLDGNRFRDRFHIHRATERYQIAGLSIEGYAEPTAAYDSVESALAFMVRSYGFRTPDEGPSLFSQKDDA